LGCELYKNAFSGWAPSGPGGGAIAQIRGREERGREGKERVGNCREGRKGRERKDVKG